MTGEPQGLSFEGAMYDGTSERREMCGLVWGKGGVQRTRDLSWALISTGLGGVWEGDLGGKNVPDKVGGFRRVH